MDRRQLLAVGRLAMAWIFLWPFFDKLLGLGFATTAENAWIRGGSPTFGFLQFGTTGPFAGIFQPMAGNLFVDLLFMVGLLGIGLALALGIGMRIACASGSLMLVLMWLAALPPAHNPFLDDHLIYPVLLAILWAYDAGDRWGLGPWWKARTPAWLH